MTKYQVRSRELIDIINEIKSRRLVLSPFFQRNLVWRQLHKSDFIKTILLGYPFPQIFVAKGSIDVDTMTSISCIVDGQQRLNAIDEYLRGKFSVDNKYFSELSPAEKEAFLKYQVPIIDLDIENEDPEIIEIFKRLNRTFYALSGVEKMSTEFAASEFMLVAKLLTNDRKLARALGDIEENEDEDEDSDGDEVPMPLQLNPIIPSSFISWARKKKAKNFRKFLLEEGVFTPYELTRQVHLMFTLNLMATYLGGYYNRNDLATRNLELFAEDFPRRDDVFDMMENVVHKFIKIKFKKKSYWHNKTNVFSLLTLFARNWEIVKDLDESEIKERLEKFSENIPQEYQIAAKEGVNNRYERLTRNEHLSMLVIPGVQQN